MTKDRSSDEPSPSTSKGAFDRAASGKETPSREREAGRGSEQVRKHELGLGAGPSCTLPGAAEVDRRAHLERKERDARTAARATEKRLDDPEHRARPSWARESGREEAQRQQETQQRPSWAASKEQVRDGGYAGGGPDKEKPNDLSKEFNRRGHER